MRIGHVLMAATLGIVWQGAQPAMAEQAGFDTFWGSFSAAVGKNDRAAIRAMMNYPSAELGKEGTQEQFDRLYESLFGPESRGCLATTKPVKDELGQYYAFCGEDIYVFSDTPGAWMLTDVGVND